MQDDLSDFAELDQLEQQAKSTAQMIYLVQAIACFIPVLWLISAVIIFFRRDEFEETWVSSHLRWQWRTVWFGALWGLLNFFLMIFPPLMWLMALGLLLWLPYRVIRGWLRLRANLSFYGV